jgi:hypothetical protein
VTQIQRRTAFYLILRPFRPMQKDRQMTPASSALILTEQMLITESKLALPWRSSNR